MNVRHALSGFSPSVGGRGVAAARDGLPIPEDLGIVGANNEAIVCELGPVCFQCGHFSRSTAEAARHNEP